MYAQGPDCKIKNCFTVRADLYSHMCKHTETYRSFWDGKQPADGDKDMPNGSTTFEAYLELMKVKGAWLGALEIAAAATKWAPSDSSVEQW